jgi:hypothetical protein
MIARSKIVNNGVNILGHLIDHDAMAGRGIKLQPIFDTVVYRKKNSIQLILIDYSKIC